VAGEIEDARKNVIKADGAWEMIVKAKSLSVGRGKKIQTFVPDEDNKEEVLKVCLGRTGNLRAPTVRSGEQVYVGFNEEMYKELTA
jgi:ATPase subunit of ABC transporter with duplicated ATPase domains